MQYKGLQFIQEGEIHFIGQSKLDNGTTVGLTVELEGWNTFFGATRPIAQIDEAFLFAFGDWGRVELGSRDAGVLPYVLRRAVGVDRLGCFQHNASTGPAPRMLANKAHARAATLHHRWPVAGREPHQLLHAALLRPADRCRLRAEDQPDGERLQARRQLPVRADIARHLRLQQRHQHRATARPTTTAWQDVFDVGANYLNKFGDFTVALYGAFAVRQLRAGLQHVARPNNANLVTGANLTAWKQWVVGAQFGFAGFTVGGVVG